MGLPLNPKVIVSSAARTASGDSGAVRAGWDKMPSLGTSLNLLIDVTAVGGDADETMDLEVQWSHDGGQTWASADGTPDTFAQITQPGGPKTVIKQFPLRAPHYRVVWTLAGTTPSFTFSASEWLT